MSNHIYQTEGFVLDSVDFSESSKIFYILTKDIGLICASAQGIRNLKSKLKFSLQNFGYAKIEAIRGKGIWRLTNSESIIGADIFKKQNDKLVIVARVFSLLRRLTHGEEENTHMFDIVLRFMFFIYKETLSEEELKNLEVIINLKILHNLGYGTDKDALHTFLIQNIGKDLLSKIIPIRGVAIEEINKAIKESQL
jgi:DNA repair protein RecO